MNILVEPLEIYSTSCSFGDQLSSRGTPLDNSWIRPRMQRQPSDFKARIAAAGDLDKGETP